MQVRCSSLPLIMQCGAAAVAPKVQVREECDAADVGTEAHELLRRLVEFGSVDTDRASPEVRALVAHGRRMWRDHLEPLFASASCETSYAVVIGDVSLTGHSDVRSGHVGTARVLDWKSGRVDHDYREQLLGYAVCELLENTMLDRVECYIGWLREEEVECYTMERSQLGEWSRRLLSRLRTERYSAGHHCAYCHRAHECAGYTAIVRRDASALLGVDIDAFGEGLASAPPERVLEIIRQAKLVSSVAERIRGIVRDYVLANGDIEEPSGARLTVTTEERRVIDTAAAWPVLQEHLADDELAACVDVRLSRAMDAVKSKAPKRGGAAAMRQLSEQLTAAGAVSSKRIYKLTERRS